MNDPAGPVCNLLYSGELWVPRACVQPLGHSGFHADRFGQTWTAAAGPVKHEYLSTACWHDDHDSCRRSCKFCHECCRCRCHVRAATEDGAS